MDGVITSQLASNVSIKTFIAGDMRAAEMTSGKLAQKATFRLIFIVGNNVFSVLVTFLGQHMKKHLIIKIRPLIYESHTLSFIHWLEQLSFIHWLFICNIYVGGSKRQLNPHALLRVTLQSLC